MLESLKSDVYKANLELPRYGLVTFTWGNVSGIDRETGLVVIKPSGVAYEVMRESDMVVCDLDGKVVEGSLKPSSDLTAHLCFYKAFPMIGGAAHTHSRWATIFAQAGRGIPPLGTTHGDYFYGEIPCSRPLTELEIRDSYERSTGEVITQCFQGIDPLSIPAALAHSHGPFTWGASAGDAVHNAVVLEECAMMAWHTLILNPNIGTMQQAVLDKHYYRKNGANAYYGQ